jgi:uncharacterized protein (TIGR03118 family)
MCAGQLGRMAICAAAWLLAAQPARAQFYEQHNLVSDVPGEADVTDPLLVNAWGLAAGPTPWWVANAETEVATIYNVSTGTAVPLPLIVSVPGGPTGIVFNSSAGFLLDDGQPARFMFATEGGGIWAWNFSQGTQAVLKAGTDGAIYKGLAIATTDSGTFIYATNFHAGTVEVYNSSFASVPGGFEDPTIPPGYAPSGIANLNGTIYVTYAVQDEEGEDDVPGVGHGFVNAFDTSGNLLQRVVSGNELNSPWGLALAPAGFGKFSGDLLVGNFGDGQIHAYDPGRSRMHGEYIKAGQLHSADGAPLKIDGLWGLAFGNDGAAGPKTTLFFTAGPEDEAHGLFGSLTPTSPSTQ